MNGFDAGECLAAAREAMELEARAILAAAARLDSSFAQAVELLAAQPGKVLVTGIGKSGHVARKIAATLCSTGAPAVFLHPAEASHGDLGLCVPGDCALLISNSGATPELLDLVPHLRALGIPLVGLVGNRQSPLARQVDIVLDASAEREADPGNVAPTASAAVALALGDALAIALMQARDFTREEFHRRHPGGALGAGLRLRVREVMHQPGEVATVAPRDGIRQVVIAMTRHPLGAACVLGPDGRLAGLITDGDLRRALERHPDFAGLTAGGIMTAGPVVTTPETLLLDALRLMEDRPSQISVLPVVEPASGEWAGLLRLHDIYLAAFGRRGPSPKAAS
jgi:arabinose-5-phosphate isomerase